MPNKLLVSVANTRAIDDEEAAKLGKAILHNKTKALVLYRRKKWDLNELVQHLADRVKVLEKNQCIPSVKCLFEGREYMDNKYLGEE